MNSDQLIALFDQEFLQTDNTQLLGGASEPVYRPAKGRLPAQVTFSYDYVSSALHEIAHWCIAGVERRELEDYGYWYQADRDAITQREFEAAESRPQALERIFSEALGIRFQASFDRLAEPEYNGASFLAAIEREYKRLDDEGVPPRAKRFKRVLSRARV